MSCSCRVGDRLCTLCREGLFAQLRGVAACRGERWAIDVARRFAGRRCWPAFEGRAAELARRKVTDMTRDPEPVDMLARELATWAAQRSAIARPVEAQPELQPEHPAERAP